MSAPRRSAAPAWTTALRAWWFCRRHGLPPARGLRLVGHAPALDLRGRLVLGAHVQLDGRLFPVRLTTLPGAVLEIGRGCYLNRGTAIAAARSVRLGEDCLVGEWVSILDTDFHPVHGDQPVAVSPVEIGNNVWLGNRATILRGVHIGDHAVVGAGAVVTHDLPARAIAVGNPARLVGTVRCDDSFRRNRVAFP